MLSYRPPCGCSASCAWACAWACPWAWSCRAGSGAGLITTGRGRATGSAAGHRRQQPDLVARGDRRPKPVEVADVLTVHVDVHESVQLALARQQLVAQRREPAHQRVDDLADRRTVDVELLLATHRRAQHRGDP